MSAAAHATSTSRSGKERTVPRRALSTTDGAHQAPKPVDYFIPDSLPIVLPEGASVMMRGFTCVFDGRFPPKWDGHVEACDHIHGSPRAAALCLFEHETKRVYVPDEPFYRRRIVDSHLFFYGKVAGEEASLGWTAEELRGSSRRYAHSSHSRELWLQRYADRLLPGHCFPWRDSEALFDHSAELIEAIRARSARRPPVAAQAQISVETEEMKVIGRKFKALMNDPAKRDIAAAIEVDKPRMKLVEERPDLTVFVTVDKWESELARLIEAAKLPHLVAA